MLDWVSTTLLLPKLLTVMEELDSAGKVKEHKEKVYQVNFQNGATHAKLLEVDGHPPAEADLKKQAENESNARQMTGRSKSCSYATSTGG